MSKVNERKIVNFLQNNDNLEVSKDFLSNYKDYSIYFLNVYMMNQNLMFTEFHGFLRSDVVQYFENVFFDQLTSNLKHINKPLFKKRYIDMLDTRIEKKIIDDLINLKFADFNYSGYSILNAKTIVSKLEDFRFYISSYVAGIKGLKTKLCKECNSLKNTTQIINSTFSIISKQENIRIMFSDFFSKKDIQLKYRNNIIEEIDILNILQDIGKMRREIMLNLIFSQDKTIDSYYERNLITHIWMPLSYIYYRNMALYTSMYIENISYKQRTCIIIASDISYILEFMEIEYLLTTLK